LPNPLYPSNFCPSKRPSHTPTTPTLYIHRGGLSSNLHSKTHQWPGNTRKDEKLSKHCTQSQWPPWPSKILNSLCTSRRLRSSVLGPHAKRHHPILPSLEEWLLERIPPAPPSNGPTTSLSHQ
jgi:hypothetical protein